jgi:hypothetical protein
VEAGSEDTCGKNGIELYRERGQGHRQRFRHGVWETALAAISATWSGQSTMRMNGTVYWT